MIVRIGARHIITDDNMGAEWANVNGAGLAMRVRSSASGLSGNPVVVQALGRETSEIQDTASRELC